MYRYFGDTERISEKKSKRFSKKSIEPPTTSDNILAPSLSYIGNKVRVKQNKNKIKLHLPMKKQ